MSGLLSYSHPQQPAQMPVAIDYPAALALRQMALVQDELPKYLLAPEVSALLHYVPDLHRKMLLATLWNTGARINEALALTRGDFSLVPPYPFVQLATLKQRTEKAARTAGRRRRGDILGAGHPAYVPPLLRDAYAVCRHTTEGFAEPDGPQID